MRDAVFGALAVLALSCGSPAPNVHVATTPAPDAGPSAKPETEAEVDPSVPADLRDAVKRSQHAGVLLAAFDHAAAVASDALRGSGNTDLDRVLGFLAYPTDTDNWRVSFFVGDPPAIGFRVDLGRQKAPSVQRVDPPETPSAQLAAMFRARQTVIATLKAANASTQRLDPVVFPAAILGESGMLVYMLAGTDRDDTVVLGKHWRARTSDDGTKLLELEPMSKTALELPAHPRNLPPGATPAGLYATHLVTPYPLESHVFASLLSGLSIFVMTSRGAWKVDGAKITYVGEKPPQ